MYIKTFGMALESEIRSSRLVTNSYSFATTSNHGPQHLPQTLTHGLLTHGRLTLRSSITHLNILMPPWSPRSLPLTSSSTSIRPQ
jgi:hypothetical protein